MVLIESGGQNCLEKIETLRGSIKKESLALLKMLDMKKKEKMFDMISEKGCFSQFSALQFPTTG